MGIYEVSSTTAKLLDCCRIIDQVYSDAMVALGELYTPESAEVNEGAEFTAAINRASESLHKHIITSITWNLADLSNLSKSCPRI